MKENPNFASYMGTSFKGLAALMLWGCITYIVTLFVLVFFELWGSPISAHMYVNSYPKFQYFATAALWVFCIYRIFYLSSRAGNSRSLDCLGIAGVITGIIALSCLGKNPNLFGMGLEELPSYLFAIFYLIAEGKYLLKGLDKSWQATARDSFGVSFFHRRYQFFAGICVISLIFAAIMGQQKYEQEFLRVHQALSVHPQLSEVKRLINNNALLDEIGAISKKISDDVNTKMEIVYLVLDGKNVKPLEVDDEAQMRQTRGLRLHQFHRGMFYTDKDVWNKFRASKVPYLYQSYYAGTLDYVPLIGFMSFNTAEGELQVMVKTPNLHSDAHGFFQRMYNRQTVIP